ncbi:hypothetical protein N5853_10340 [Bartonella sp. HY329]|uniref:hypothetical protein n=1 Tax=unclassified Bartonella TaxID=2645622 RepID=UPI0021C9729F|nr:MULTISPECIES: hypothetical protein [unclassified Bartonella]UXM94498.1 hypothetical protein N5853_10340 [Bartonella sp. HY329]UXN08822.1 hypothetical protein N5852_10350 [Bartonella sp. HY328]
MAEAPSEITLNVRGLGSYDFKMLLTALNQEAIQNRVSEPAKKIYRIINSIPLLFALSIIFCQTVGISKMSRTTAIGYLFSLLCIKLVLLIANSATCYLRQSAFINFYSDNMLLKNGFQLILNETQLQIKSQYAHHIYSYEWIRERIYLENDSWLIIFYDQSYISIYCGDLGNDEISEQAEQWLKIS